MLTANKPIDRSSPPSVRGDEPPAYSPPVPARPVSASRNGQAAVPSSPPVNGLYLYTKREAIRGSWALDPLAALLPTQNLVQMFLDGKPSKKRFRTPKGIPPTATFSSRHGSVQAILRVVENASVRSTAKVYSKTRSGNITLDFNSIAPMRTVHIDARSRRGNVTLLVPRNFSGLVQLSSRHGSVEMLPALAASARIVQNNGKETTVLVGDGPMPQVGSDDITDTARLYSRHGRIRLGYSGEDFFTEPPKLIDQALKVVQKLIMEKVIMPRSLPPKRGVHVSFS